MRGLSAIIVTCAVAWSGAALANASENFIEDIEVRELAPYFQCVPYARERSGVQLYGDAHTWWDQAAGRYMRGSLPRQGAVMAFRPTSTMVLGHVATVSRVINRRTVLLDHANWSPVRGRRGQIERGVKAIDVSSANDWSQVRVWYAPLQDIGTTAWPVAGFIYNERDSAAPLGGQHVLAQASRAERQEATIREPSQAFASAFADMASAQPAPSVASIISTRPVRAAHVKPRDPIDAAIARYGS